MENSVEFFVQSCTLLHITHFTLNGLHSFTHFSVRFNFSSLFAFLPMSVCVCLCVPMCFHYSSACRVNKHFRFRFFFSNGVCVCVLLILKTYESSVGIISLEFQLELCLNRLPIFCSRRFVFFLCRKQFIGMVYDNLKCVRGNTYYNEIEANA